MRATIHKDPARLDISVYVETAEQNLNPDGTWERMSMGQVREPYLTIHPDVFFAIASAIQAEPLADGSQSHLANSLKDAREVRDRLLKMIENEWQSKQLEKP